MFHYHKKWRALIKKQKRKLKRQSIAKARDAASSADGDGVCSEEDAAQLAQEESKRQEQHALWEQRERLAQAEWRAKKEKEANERARKEAEEAAIKAEWEERIKQEREEEEKLKEKKAKQAKLLRQATSDSKQDDGSWHNPLAPAGHDAERKANPCPFFMKVGACRFGNQCSRTHDIPEVSTTLLIPGMYSHFALEQGLLDEFDSDLSLEYEENETYLHFREFYNDVLPEFKSVGRVVQFKVCCNFEPHLRGNVYVQYLREEDAETAFMMFNGRFYGGRQLQCSFTVINSWKSAICGLFSKKSCPKGKSCNFLHVFPNPRREFLDADMDLSRHKSSDGRRSSRRNGHSDYSYRESRNKHSPSRRKRSRSKSPRSWRKSSRSPSRSRLSSRSRSRRKSRSKSPSRSRQKSHSISPSRSRRTSHSKSPSRSRHKRSYSRSPISLKRRRRSKSISPLRRSERKSLESRESSHSMAKEIDRHRRSGSSSDGVENSTQLLEEKRHKHKSKKSKKKKSKKSSKEKDTQS